MVKLLVLETEKPGESLILGRGIKDFAYRFRPFSRWPKGPEFKVFTTIMGTEISVDECRVNDEGEVIFRVKGDPDDGMAFVRDWIEREGWKVEIERAHSQVKFKEIRFLKDAPSIVGVDMNVYGPFTAGKVYALPVANANLFIKQGVAEPVREPPKKPSLKELMTGETLEGYVEAARARALTQFMPEERREELRRRAEELIKRIQEERARG